MIPLPHEQYYYPDTFYTIQPIHTRKHGKSPDYPVCLFTGETCKQANSQSATDHAYLVEVRYSLPDNLSSFQLFSISLSLGILQGLSEFSARSFLPGGQRLGSRMGWVIDSHEWHKLIKAWCPICHHQRLVSEALQTEGHPWIQLHVYWLVFI